MKLLKDILYKARIEEVIGSTNLAIDQLAFDSRKVEAFYAFVAIRGTQVDGHEYIEQAIERGAVGVICEELPARLHAGVTYVRVKDSSEALAYMAVNYFDQPSTRLKLAAVTGTNGKTSVATLLHQLFTALGYKCGLLSTVVNRIGKEELSATHTTPDALSVNKLIQQMADAGCTHCFMEASSHAIHQHRITGLDIDVAMFTNITHDHLDYHGTFDNYIRAKKALFDQLKSEAYALVNKDDAHWDVMVQNTVAQLKTYAMRTTADYKVRIIENQFGGMQLSLNQTDVWTKLVGRFNASNLGAVYGAALLLDQDELTVLTELSNLDSVAGRFEHIKSPDNITGIIDYAHTPDALKNVLTTIKDIRTGNEQVITVVGCGGDRDRAKRPEMAKIACQLSDKVVFTSDNPRSEDPSAIIRDMETGVPGQHYKKTLSIVDRKEGIKAAVSMAESGDIVLVAGKGHENYQEIKGVRHPFDDLAILSELFKNMRS